MSIVDYATLQAAVASWTARTTLTNIPDFIMLFETVANRRLRVRQQEVSVPLTPVNAVATLPADFLTWRQVYWNGSAIVELEYANPTYLYALYPSSPQDRPRMFTIEGNNLTVRPADNGPLQFDYFQKIPPLATATNWLITAYPDLYLCGAMVEASGFMKDYAAMSAWAGRREDLFTEIERLDVKSRGSAAVRVMGATP